MFRTSKTLSQEKVQARAGRLFIAPSMTVFTLFVFIPLIASFVFSFLKTNLANVCQGLFSESCTEKGRTKRTHQIAGFETMM